MVDIAIILSCVIMRRIQTLVSASSALLYYFNKKHVDESFIWWHGKGDEGQAYCKFSAISENYVIVLQGNEFLFIFRKPCLFCQVCIPLDDANLMF